MKWTLSLKIALVSVCLVVLVVGVTSYVMVFRLAANSELEIVKRDRELAKVLAGLRTADERLDFQTLTSFVGSSDKVETGLVYAIEVGTGGEMLQGALNPRLFGELDPTFQVHVRQGRKRVLEMLATGKIDRLGRIKEYSLPIPKGNLRLGFDLQRIDEQIQREQKVGMTVLLSGLLIGILAAILLARRLARPVRYLAGAMEAVARGDIDQTVQVKSSDELASLASSFNKMTRALRDLGRIRDLFALYVAEPVVQRILREREPLEMVAEERAVTAVSFAFHDFSTIARQLSSREMIHLLNEYLAPIIDAVMDCGGVVSKIEGERILAVWGAPDDVVEPELKAIESALIARAAVEREGRRQTAAGGIALKICIGACTGRVIAGNIGSSRRLTYSVLHGAIDLTRHIEELAQPGEFLVSEATFNKVRSSVEAGACAPLMLEDLEEAIPLYRVERISGVNTLQGTVI